MIEQIPKFPPQQLLLLIRGFPPKQLVGWQNLCAGKLLPHGVNIGYARWIWGEMLCESLIKHRGGGHTDAIVGSMRIFCAAHVNNDSSFPWNFARDVKRIDQRAIHSRTAATRFCAELELFGCVGSFAGKERFDFVPYQFIGDFPFIVRSSHKLQTRASEVEDPIFRGNVAGFEILSVEPRFPNFRDELRFSAWWHGGASGGERWEGQHHRTSTLSGGSQCI